MRYLRTLGRALRATSLIVGNTVILLIVVLLIGEWWARRVSPPAAEAAVITVLNQQGAYHPWAGFRNTPGFRYELGNWVPVVINSWGWRGPEPTIARNKSVKRAMLLGDSVAFACWGCRQEATLGGILKRALEVRTGEEWEVIDTSVGAGFSSMSLGTLAHDGIQFRPDVVFTLNGPNDLLVLDERTMLRMGGGAFAHSLYHTTQLQLEKVYDARTGTIQQLGMRHQLARRSALFRVLFQSSLAAAVQADALTGAPAPPTSAGYSTAHPERLDAYVSNQLAMSYLAEGSGAKFVSFMPAYLSAKHKILGDEDKAILKTQEPSLVRFFDEAMPILVAKLQEAASQHPSMHFVDLSLFFTREQAFSDLSHLRYESIDKSASYDMLCARMADDILRVLYPGKTLPDWRSQHLADTPHDWSDEAYLAANPDVRALITAGQFKNGFEHYRAKGFLEFRPSGYPSWNEREYLAANPDVPPLIARGEFASGYEHFVKRGKAEGRQKGLAMRWIEDSYLAANPDVAEGVASGKFKSGEEHFMKIGAALNRRGGFSGWDEEGYLIEYGDVRNAVLSKIFRSGFDHYLKAGATEHRHVALGLSVLH
jgi:hypothetical protein